MTITVNLNEVLTVWAIGSVLGMAILIAWDYFTNVLSVNCIATPIWKKKTNRVPMLIAFCLSWITVIWVSITWIKEVREGRK